MSVIRLDLDALIRTGQLSPADAARLRPLALPDRRGSLLINLLLVFGSVAAALAAIALVPNAATGLVLAILALGGCEALRRQTQRSDFAVLASGLALMGILGLAGWTTWQFNHVPATQTALLVTLILAAGAIRYRSSFLAVLGVLGLGAVFGSGTGYWHASYAVFIEQPALTILVFGALSAVLYRLRSRLGADWQHLATTAARTGLFLVHMAFWIGALWGDRIGETLAANADTAAESGLNIHRFVFTAGWTALSLALAALTRRGGFASVSALVFLGIHFYTQYFELLGAHPVSLLVAGLILVGLAVGLAALFRRRERDTHPPLHSPPAE
ncbi:MAG: hypothetical protein ACK46Q_07780 [Hyphomonas sp.]